MKLLLLQLHEVKMPNEKVKQSVKVWVTDPKKEKKNNGSN